MKVKFCMWHESNFDKKKKTLSFHSYVLCIFWCLFMSHANQMMWKKGWHWVSREIKFHSNQLFLFLRYDQIFCFIIKKFLDFSTFSVLNFKSHINSFEFTMRTFLSQSAEEQNMMFCSFVTAKFSNFKLPIFHEYIDYSEIIRFYFSLLNIDWGCCVSNLYYFPQQFKPIISNIIHNQNSLNSNDIWLLFKFNLLN